jgi:hypothetical protein
VVAVVAATSNLEADAGSLTLSLERLSATESTAVVDGDSSAALSDDDMRDVVGFEVVWFSEAIESCP